MKKKWLATFMLGSALMLGACGGDDSGTEDQDTGSETAESGTTTDASEQVAQQRCGIWGLLNQGEVQVVNE